LIQSPHDRQSRVLERRPKLADLRDHTRLFGPCAGHGVTEISVMNALDNLQPLDVRSNLSKAGSYDRENFEAYLSSKGVVFKKPHEVKS